MVQDLRELLNRRPFEPFRVCLTGGDAYEVRDPELAVMMKSRMFLALPESDGWTLVPYLHISAIESMANGHSGKTPRRKRRS